MLVDSDGELDKIFDDRLRTSKAIKPKKALMDKTNKERERTQKAVGELEEDLQDKKGISLERSKLFFSYKEKKEDILQKENSFVNPVALRNTENHKDNPINTHQKNDSEAILTDIDKELQGLILEEKAKSPEKLELNRPQGLLEDKSDKDLLRKTRLKTISTNMSAQLYLKEIEEEFTKIRESHKRMLMTRNRVLKMVEKEIEVVKREVEKRKNKEIKNKDEEIKNKDKEIKNKEQEIKNKDEEIKNKDKDIQNKEQEIEQLKNKIQELIKNASPLNLMDNYETLEHKYSEQTKEMEELRLENSNLKREIESISEKYGRIKKHCKESVLRYKENLDKLYLNSLKNLRKKHTS